MQKLYIIVRSDLEAGLQLAQACHAVSAFACDFPAVHRAWHRDGKNIVVLAARDLPHLQELFAHAIAAEPEYPVSEFREPDLSGELTALAVASDARKLVSSLPLALKAA